MKREEFLSSLGKEVSEKGRLLLISDGSLVKLLEALYLKPITVEVEGQWIGPVRLDSPFIFHDNREVIKRDVWLKEEEKRLIFAHSLIPAGNLSERMRSRLTMGFHPLGLIIDEELLCYRKESFEICMIEWPEKAIGFGLSPNHRLWARRYRIVTEKGIIALILELFSPSLIEWNEHQATE